ncbi:MAG: phenylalanine--tRNA ligase subunit alpha [Sorangiineae bacterium]|nr:phenylalanine--tRNA ligase subunit alpha [Polyangiaceae bacterium]MEB2323089.1 phenylalanine--tRNA ligase subunit alpha [Sorangiineae bacterium]
MSDAGAEIVAGLAALGERFHARFAGAVDENELRAAKAELLGKKGELTSLLKLMGQVDADERRAIGERVNAVKAEVERAFAERLTALAQAARAAELTERPFDLTLPGRAPVVRGHRHPIAQVRDELLDIFGSLGFEIAWGPEVELEEHNFTKLAFPPDHPATDMQDSFWVKVSGAPPDARVLLRTHTSNVQVREMSTHRPPMAIVSGGTVYRRDDDVTHSPMFHQIEGFRVAERVSFAELKGVLTAFAERLYGPGTPVRFRPSYFPFVEPGAEVDVGCVFCRADDGSRATCRICKSTGWLEILGCGMVHPDVLSHAGIDPETYTGFAFGLGVERVAMLRYGIPDIRLLFENDPRFLAQF